MMAKKSKGQQDDQSSEPLENKTDQLEKEESRDSTEKKSRRKSSTSRKLKTPSSSSEAPEKVPDQNTQQDGQYIDLPEDRLGKIYTEEPEDKAKKKTRRKAPTSRKAKQDQPSADVPPKAPDEPKPSKEDLLADIRKSLASEEDVVEKKGFFGRLKDRLKPVSKAKAEKRDTQETLEGEVAAFDDFREAVIAPKTKRRGRSSTEQEEEVIQDFFSDIEALVDEVPEDGAPEKAKLQEIQPVAGETPDLFRDGPPRLPVKSDVSKEVDFEKVREVALQEYDDTRVEPTVERKASLKEEVRETIRESKPLERILLIGAFAITLGILLFAGIFVLVKSIPSPEAEPTVVINLEDQVYPARLSLPGGWEFNLGQGSVVEGEWSPQRAEWLVGTEISRWVALPWSLQLEAVLRTLKSEDPIELIMSNYDSLVFHVYSIQEMTMEEIQAQDAKIPSLIIILFGQENEANTYWVVTALP